MEFIAIGGFIALVIAIIVAAIVCTFYFEKKRTEAMQAVADSMMFSFSPKDDGTLLKSLAAHHLFSQGHSRKIANVMLGSADGTEVSVFDYRYTVGHGKNSHTWRQTVMLFRSERLQLPSFSMRPESIFHKIGSALGLQDIDFDSNAEFSKKYLLRGSDEAAIRRVFNDDVLGYFAPRSGVSAEGEGDRLVYYRTSKRVPPNEIRGFLADGFAIYGLFKAES